MKEEFFRLGKFLREGKACGCALFSVSKGYERGSYALYLILFEKISQVVILGFLWSDFLCYR